MAKVWIDTTVDIYEEIEIDVLDVLDDCDESEIKQAIEWLEDGYYINEYDTSEKTYPHNQFHQNLMSISSNYYLLTPEEQNIIEQIANKYR